MGVIHNFDDLALTPQRRDALAILTAGYEAINTGRILHSKIQLRGNELCLPGATVTCQSFDRIFFIGIGKCALDGAAAVEEILGDKLTGGIALDVRAGVLKRLKSYSGTHPFPSETNVSVTREIVQLLSRLTPRDLVLVLISGGGSSLLCLPHEINCETLTKITVELMRAGADINELNTVRKHLSQVQGGQLARLAYPARVISLIFSDVPGNDISFVASGPTVRDSTTVADAAAILAKYNILKICRLPDCQLLETPKAVRYFHHVTNLLMITSQDALAAMSAKASTLGYRPNILTDRLVGDAHQLALEWSAWLLTPGECRLAAGETTVVVNNPSGNGGRNQDFVLAALPRLPAGQVLVAAASDGWDNSPVAGAIGDVELMHYASDLGLAPIDYLRDNNSYHFFRAAGGHIITGRTGSNVSDLFIMLRARQQ